MFSFLNPLFLWAGAAALIPLVLHLMQRRRIVRLPFSTIRFLKLAHKRSSNRIRMENFLLWLLRTVLMLLLAAAFGMPMLRTQTLGNLLSKARRDVAIVLDGSFSMTYAAGLDTVWQRAVETAIGIVNGLDDGDQVCVFVANDDVKPAVHQLTADRAFVISQLRTLTPDPTPSQLCPAVLAALDSLSQEKRRREQEIHIITDGQALPWTRFREGRGEGATSAPPPDAPPPGAAPEPARTAGGGTWQPEKVGKQTAFFVTLTGVEAPENVAPVGIECQPPLLMTDTPARLRVRLGYSGAARQTTVSVFVDGVEQAARSAILDETAGGSDLTFALPPLGPGVHAASVEVAADNLLLDNAFYFLLRVKEKLPCLCVGPAPDALYLMKALQPGAGIATPIEARQVASEDLAAENLAGCSGLFLCNALPLPGQAILQVEQYVRAGGLLVVFPGDGGTLPDYDAWSCLPAKPSSIADIPTSARKRLLVWAKPQHPLLRGLAAGAGEGAAALTVSRELRWDKLPAGTETLVLAGAGAPFLLGRAAGAGYAFQFSVTADRAWSTLPLSPFFLPILHQAVQFGAGLLGRQPFLWTARSLSLAEALPEAGPGSAILAPDDSKMPLRSAVEGGRTLLRAENLMQPGIYRHAPPGGAPAQPALAVNVVRAESDLSPVRTEQIPAILDVRRVEVASGEEELQRLLHEHRVGRTLGELALWVALLVAVVEVFYANRRSKAPPALSETLEVEPSGKVRGERAAE